MRRAYNMLRSRRLAVWLIIGVCIFAGAATLVPLGDPRSPEVAAWATRYPEIERVVGPLGLHQPFTTPVFIALAVLLTLSTAACSWERTERAWAFWRAATPEAWHQDPHGRASFSVRVSSQLNAAEVVDDAFKSLGMRSATHVGESSVSVGRRHREAVFGSPVFHWALVALFLAAGAGQMTRSEGFLLITEGAALPEARESYAPGLTTGTFFGERFTGAQVAIDEIVEDHVVSGVERGDSPRVTVTKNGRVVASEVIYPNHPLRFGAVVIHRGDPGPALKATISLPNGKRLVGQGIPLPGGNPAGGATGDALVIEEATGKSVRLTFAQASGGRVVVGAPGAGGSGKVVGVGETVELPGGIRVTIEDLTVFFRLAVVNDWSVPFIYAAFTLACVAAAVALLFPPRVVAVVYRPGDDLIDIWVLRKRIDPAFPSRVRAAFNVEPSEGIEET